MPKILSNIDMTFPPGDSADEHGIVALGGDFSCARLLSSYRSGIFPWPHDGLPILWFCPDPRFILEPHNLIINQSLKKAIKRSSLTIKADSNFRAVMKSCQGMHRKGQDGTWITDDMIDGYEGLFQQGFAHSVEAYQDGWLVGGLYGVSIGSIFFGESMFFLQANASKLAFITLVAHLLAWNFSLIDCQAHTQHLEKFGAYPIDRKLFLEKLALSQNDFTKKGPWHFYLSPLEALRYLEHYQSLASRTS